MTQVLEQIIHNNAQKPTHCIIWMHGLGASANDFEPILPYLGLNDTTKVIFPQAPIRSVTVNNGMSMPAWYDIYDFSFRDADMEGINDSAEKIHRIYLQQIELGIAAENIYFAGFSQGGVMALHLGTRNLCGGILALSTYLADVKNTPVAKTPPIPIMQMHGRHDPVIRYEHAKESYVALEKKGYKPSWKEYNMGHEVVPEQIADIANWLKALGL